MAEETINAGAEAMIVAKGSCWAEDEWCVCNLSSEGVDLVKSAGTRHMSFSNNSITERPFNVIASDRLTGATADGARAPELV